MISNFNVGVEMKGTGMVDINRKGKCPKTTQNLTACSSGQQVLKASLLCRSATVNAADFIEEMLVLVVVSIFCKYYRPPQQQLGADQ